MGGPGVGKTSELMSSGMRGVIERGTRRVLLLAHLNKVRNNLSLVAVNAGFRDHVRVVGTSGLDCLSKMLTTGALVWQRVKGLVLAHESRLTKLRTAAFHVATLGLVKRRLTEHIAAMVASYGAFRATLATMHDVAAEERYAIETHIAIVRKDVITSTRLLVCTIGSLFRPSAMRDVSSDAGKLAILMANESTRIMKFEIDMLIASLQRIMDEETRVALLGDPCQNKIPLRTLPCTASLLTDDPWNRANPISGTRRSEARRYGQT